MQPQLKEVLIVVLSDGQDQQQRLLNERTRLYETGTIRFVSVYHSSIKPMNRPQMERSPFVPCIGLLTTVFIHH